MDSQSFLVLVETSLIEWRWLEECSLFPDEASLGVGGFGEASYGPSHNRNKVGTPIWPGADAQGDLVLAKGHQLLGGMKTQCWWQRVVGMCEVFWVLHCWWRGTLGMWEL